MKWLRRGDGSRPVLCVGCVPTREDRSRYPSAANGCVGFKPTYGRVSRHGVFALAASMDHVGPMTRTVEDATIMFEAMAGPNPRDPRRLPDPVPPVRAELDRGIAGLRVGFDRRYATDNVDPDVASAMDDVLAELTRLGATVRDRQRAGRQPRRQRVARPACAVEALAANAKTFPSRASEYQVRGFVLRSSLVSE